MFQENGTGLPSKRSADFSQSSKISDKVQERNPSRERLLSTVDMVVLASFIWYKII